MKLVLLLCYALVLVCLYGVSDGFLLQVSNNKVEQSSCPQDCVKQVKPVNNKGEIEASCGRGCRYYDIAQLIYLGNSTKLGCINYCGESYKDISGIGLTACKAGCESAKPRLAMDVPLIAEISWSFFIESTGEIGNEGEDVVDSSPFRQIQSGLDRFKIPDDKPQPIKANEAPVWKGIPHCLVASLLLLLVILALLLGLLIEESSSVETTKQNNMDYMSLPPPPYDVQEQPLPEKQPIV